MIQADDVAEACVCPDCGYRCNACLGTGTVIPREQVLAMKNTEWFHPSFEGAQEENEGE